MVAPITVTAASSSNAILALMTQGSASPWAALKAMLYTAGPAPGFSSVLSQYTAATFSGYAAASVTQGASYIGPDGLVHVTFASVQFTATGSAGLPQTILGYGLTNTAGTVWVGGGVLPAPVVLSLVGSGLTIEPDLVYGS